MRAAGLTLVSASAVGFGFTYADQAAVVPLLAAELGLSDLQIGLLSAAVFASYIAITLVTSGLPDRVGPKPVIAAGIAASALGTALFGIGATFAVLIVAKLVQGVGSALAFVAAARYIAGLYGADRPYFGLGLYGAGYPLGSALALVAMPQIATILGGWRPSFGLEALLLAGLFAIWLRAPSVSGVRREGSMLDALRCANCWLVSLQHAAGFGLAIAAGSWITVFLLREFSLPLALSGVLGSILLFVAVLTRPLGGLAVTTGLLPTKAVMRTGDLAVLIGVVLLALPGRPLPVALFGAVVVGAGVGLPYAPVFNTAAASLSRAPGAAQGLAAVGGTMGVMVGAPAMGYLVQTFGFAAAWGFVGLVGLLALLGTLLMRGEEELSPGRE